MKRIIVAMLALLTVTAPAHAAFDDPTFAPEVLSLNLTYPDDLALTGDLDIGLGAPGVAVYRPFSGNSSGLTLTPLSVNGSPLTIVTSGLLGGGPAYIYALDHSITFPVLTIGDPNYGNPLFLAPSDIQLDGLTALSGIVTCTSECQDAVAPTPLPAALPLFASAMAALGGVGWFKRKRGEVSA
jgi:hypothetical protein